MDMVRSGLLLELYGPAASQIIEPVASDDSGEFSGWWFVISQAWVNAVLLELPVLCVDDIRPAFTEISREIAKGGKDHKVGPPSGLTWRRYGRGLQAEAEAALKALIVARAEQKAKRAAEEAMRKREVECAKEANQERCPFEG
jgi:hypothetical protein